MIERPVFAIGDSVKPKPGWQHDERDRVVPSGRVVKVVAFGKGQLVYVEGDDKKAFISGVFEKVQ